MKIIKNPNGYYDKVCGHCPPCDMHNPVARLQSKYLTLVDCDGIYCEMHLKAVLCELRQKANQVEDCLEELNG